MVSFRFFSKFVSLFILIGLFLAFVLPIKAHFLEDSPEAIQAEEAAARLPKVFLLPDSFFYFLKTFKEKIQSFFIFSVEDKMTFQMDLANKRLAELVDLIHKNQESYMEKSLERLESSLHTINNLMIKAQKDKGFNIEVEKRHTKLLNDHEIVLLNMEDDILKELKNTYHHILDVIDQSRDHMEHKVEQVPTQPLEEKHEEEEHSH